MRKLTLLAALVAVAVPVWGQGTPVIGLAASAANPHASDPYPCTATVAGHFYWNTTASEMKQCDGSTNPWPAWAGGGSGASNFVDLNDVTSGLPWDLTGAADEDPLCIDDIASQLTIVPCKAAITGRTDSDGTVALLSTDRAKYVNATNTTANAVSIAQAGTAGFEAGYFVYLRCAEGAGVCTLTPTTSTINGNTTLVLNQASWALVVSDGTNYYAASVRNFSTLTYLHYSADGGTLDDTDDATDLWIAKFPITITEICGKTDTGTSTFNIQRNDGSAASIAASNITAATTEACTSTFNSGENIISIGHVLDFLQVTGAASGSPTRITVTISYVRR